MKKHILLIAIVSLCRIGIAQDCNCDHTIEPSGSGQIFDAAQNNVQPGDIICLMAGEYNQYMAFYNLAGTKDEPIIITNCGGVMVMNASTTGFDTYDSHDFVITGTGSNDHFYGIQVLGGSDGIRCNFFSNNYQIDHVLIDGASNHGLDLKNDPLCSDPRTWRSSGIENEFVIVHDTHVKNIGREGFYIGGSHFHVETPCLGQNSQPVYEAIIQKAEIYNNLVEDTGNDGIQIGSVSGEALIYNNIVRNFGITDGTGVHRSGFQINPGTKAHLYNNLVAHGVGTAYFISGDGLLMYNNVAYDAKSGIESYNSLTSQSSSYVAFNNTFVDIFESGIAVITEDFTRPSNYFYNNIVHLTDGDYYGYGSTLAWPNENEFNNVYTENLGDLGLKDPENYDFSLTSNSTDLIDKGDCGLNNISTDFDGFTRSFGSSCDIGAFEFTTVAMATSENVIDFGEFMTRTPDEVVSYEFTGSNFRGPVKIPVPENFLISIQEDTFDDIDTLLLTYDENREIISTIYVKLAPSQTGTIEDKLIHIAEDAENLEMTLNAIIDITSTKQISAVVNVFPNPIDSSSKLVIEMHNAPADLVGLQLLDASGKVLLQENFQSKNFAMDLPSDIQKGMFFLKLFIGDQTQLTKKILITN